jgi:hypothetical protein
MATVKELITRFGFDVDTKGLTEVENGVAAVRDGLLGLGAVAVGAAVTLFGFVQAAAKSGEQLAMMSEQAGVGIEAIQRLAFRANLANVSTEELSQSLNFLNRNLYEARTGSVGAQKAFAAAGISLAQLKDKSFTADKAMELIGKRFVGLPAGPEKAGIAMDLFGRGGARMVAMLGELGKELDPVHAKILEMSIITDKQAKAGDEFGDSLDVLLIGWKSMAKTIGFELMPVVKDIIDQAMKWLVANKNLVKTNITAFVKGLSSALRFTLRIIDVLIKSFTGFASTIGGVETATKLLLGALAVLSGASVLIGIGMITTGMYGLIASMTIAKIAAVGMWGAIGLGFVALFLILEDISSYFQGKDSFLGDLLELIPEIGETFERIFEPLFEPLLSLFKLLSEGTLTWGEAFKLIGGWILNLILSPITRTAAMLGGLFSLLGRWTGSDALKDLGKAGYDVADLLTFKGGAFEAAPVTPIAATRSAAGGGRSSTMNTNFSQVNNFPPGTDPAKVADKIASSSVTGIEDILAMANQSTASGGAH